MDTGSLSDGLRLTRITQKWTWAHSLSNGLRFSDSLSLFFSREFVLGFYFLAYGLGTRGWELEEAPDPSGASQSSSMDRELLQAPSHKYLKELVSRASIYLLRSTRKAPEYPMKYPALLERFVPAPKLPGTRERRVRHF